METIRNGNHLRMEMAMFDRKTRGQVKLKQKYVSENLHLQMIRQRLDEMGLSLERDTVRAI